MLHPHLMVFHGGLPVELLWCVAATTAWQEWRVRPLFVDKAVERNEIFRPGEPLRPIHGRLACNEVRL